MLQQPPRVLPREEIRGHSGRNMSSCYEVSNRIETFFFFKKKSGRQHNRYDSPRVTWGGVLHLVEESDEKEHGSNVIGIDVLSTRSFLPGEFRQ